MTACWKSKEVWSFCRWLDTPTHAICLSGPVEHYNTGCKSAAGMWCGRPRSCSRLLHSTTTSSSGMMAAAAAALAGVLHRLSWHGHSVALSYGLLARTLRQVLIDPVRPSKVGLHACKQLALLHDHGYVCNVATVRDGNKGG